MPLTNTCAVTKILKILSLKKFTLEVKLRCRFSLEIQKILSSTKFLYTKGKESFFFLFFFDSNDRGKEKSMTSYIL